MEVLVKTYKTPKEANRDAERMARDGWYPQGTVGGGTGFSPIKGAAKGTATGAALFLMSGGVIPPVAGFLGRKKWRTGTPITITWVRVTASTQDGPTGARQLDRAVRVAPALPSTSGGTAVEYDLRNWQPEDIERTVAQVKHWRIPHRWDAPTKVLTVPSMYEEAMNKLVLGEG